MFKIIELIKRQANYSASVFQDAWKNQLGLQVSSVPGVRRYVQSHVLLQGYARGELLFDGISEMWFDDESACAVAMNSPQLKAVEREASCIMSLAECVRMPVDVHVIKDGEIPEQAVKNIEFVNRRPGMPLEVFRKYWRNIHGPIASRIPVLLRYEQNHLKRALYEGPSAPPYDGLAITWFRSTADMKVGATTPEYGATRADELNFLRDGHLPIIITREHVVLT